jgi:glycosyltransferase involved in cell wall biosynthesis
MTDTPRNIVMVCTSAPWHPGPRARIIPLAAYGIRQGIPVTLLCLDTYARTTPTNATTIDGVPVIPVAQMHVGADGTALRGLSLVWTAICAIVAFTRELMRRQPTDIVIAKAQPMNGIAACIAGWWCGARLHLDSDDDEAGSHQSAHWFMQHLLGMFERWLPSQVTTTTCATDWQTERLRARGIPSVQTVPNGLSDNQLMQSDAVQKLTIRQRYGLPPTYIVYAGNLSTSAHAVDLLIEAYAGAAVDVPLVIAGSGHERAALHQLAQQRRCEQTIHWLGNIPVADIPALLAGAIASVDPVRQCDAAAARCPLKILESMAQGTPVITSDLGDRSRILGPAGIYAAPGDVCAYANAIRTVCAARSQAQRQVPDMHACAWQTIAPRWYTAHGLVPNEVAYA